MKEEILKEVDPIRRKKIERCSSNQVRFDDIVDLEMVGEWGIFKKEKVK